MATLFRIPLNAFQAFSKTGDELSQECMFWALMLVALGVIDAVEYFLGVSRTK